MYLGKIQNRNDIIFINVSTVIFVSAYEDAFLCLTTISFKQATYIMGDHAPLCRVGVTYHESRRFHCHRNT